VTLTTALITGAFSLIGVLFAAFFASRSKTGETKVTEIAEIFDGYKDIVHALQTEVRRLEERVENLTEVLAVCEKDMENCEKRNTSMQEEIDRLKAQIGKLTKDVK
jgi:peptidoglycan hydrolase CwlO-like protein